MTEKVNPSVNRPAEPFKTAGAIAHAGGSTDGWISPSGSPSDIAVQDGGITDSNLNEFTESHSTTSFDVTIDGGEAFVYGSWLAIDTQTVVTLAGSTLDQTVYVGWNKGGTNDVIIGLQSDFDNDSGNTDKKIPLYEFDTDSSGVIEYRDLRYIGRTIDEKGFGNNPDARGNIIERAGHDEVDVPQVVTRTVEDFESGNLDADEWNTTFVGLGGGDADALVQSDTAYDGTYSLQLQSQDEVYVESDSISVYPQQGDFISYATKLGNANTDSYFYLGEGLEYEIRISGSANGNKIEVSSSASSDEVSLDGSQQGVWIYVEIEWSEDEFSVNIEYSGNSYKASVPATDVVSGNVRLRHKDRSSSGFGPTWFDSVSVKRRSPQYFTNTKKGTTELGNEVTPSGSIQTGPKTANTNAERAVYQDAPVDSNATQGAESILTLLQSGVTPAAFVRRTLDGQGGAYGHQLDGALGRFARLNANLSWEYDTLADVPYYDTNSDGGNYTFEVNSRPRRLHVSHDGSNGRGVVNGAVIATKLLSVKSLGPFRLVWKDVSYNNNQFVRIGAANNAPDPFVDDGFAITLRPETGLPRIGVSTGGTVSNSGFNTEPNWSNTHDLFIEYDGTEVRAGYDGQIEASISYSTNSDFRPTIQVIDDGSKSASEAVEASQIIIEPLPEVLQ